MWTQRLERLRRLAKLAIAQLTKLLKFITLPGIVFDTRAERMGKQAGSKPPRPKQKGLPQRTDLEFGFIVC